MQPLPTRRPSQPTFIAVLQCLRFFNTPMLLRLFFGLLSLLQLPSRPVVCSNHFWKLSWLAFYQKLPSGRYLLSSFCYVKEALEEIKTSAQRNGYGGVGYNNFGGGFSPRGGVRRTYRGRGRGRGGGGLRRSGSWGNLSTISQSGNINQTGNFRRARSRSREPRRGFGRSASVGRMQRSSSVSSLRSVSSFKGTGGGRGRGRGRGASRGRGGNFNTGGRLYRSASMTSLNSSFRGRGGRGRGRGQRGANSVASGFVNRRDQNRRGRGGFSRGGRGGPRGGGRGRGAGRGGRGGAPRGRGGRGGRWQKEPLPDRDALDKELDQYMSGSRAHLDKELDNYMSEKWE